MNVVTGKWNFDRFKELSALMENDVLKQEAEIMEKECRDGDFIKHILLEIKLLMSFNFLSIQT